MTRQVALSNEAYAALKREKGDNESFSDLVVRLMQEARSAKRDIMRLAAFPHKFTMTMEEHLRFVEEMRDADHVGRAWDEEKERQGAKTRKRNEGE